ncbi:MAG: hypothetical protein K8R92_09770 [Planctomycetes bacterium]|nr:hypothetical protein [Planctomycetota bacterium]
MPRATTKIRNRKPASTMRTAPPYVFSRLSPVNTTPVYESYWRFAAERQAILMRRARGTLSPWTNDPVLLRHKFTNAYRAADRVSQFLIAQVIYRGSDRAEEVVFRILLFKLFNKIETWHLLQRHLGELAWKGFNPTRYASVLTRARTTGLRIYSGAYIMPSGRSTFGSAEKHRNHLALINYMMKDGIVNRVTSASSLGAVYEALRSYPTLGPFLAFQLAIDLNYSPVMDFDEMTFVVPGPGARDGIAKCFGSRGGLSEVDLIKLVADRQDHEFEQRGLQFERLGDRRLQLIDCQNLFCEVDKYARVIHPKVIGLTGRTRIKQVFQARPEPLALWFPPKWKINDLLSKQLRRTRT